MSNTKYWEEQYNLSNMPLLSIKDLGSLWYIICLPATRYFQVVLLPQRENFYKERILNKGGCHYNYLVLGRLFLFPFIYFIVWCVMWRSALHSGIMHHASHQRPAVRRQCCHAWECSRELSTKARVSGGLS